MKNKILIDQFSLLIKQIKFDIDNTKGKEQMINMYRLNSINKVLNVIKNYPAEIINSDQLKGIIGVGKNSLERIDEILKTHKLKEVVITKNDNKNLEIIEKLQSVFGIGRKTAYDLFKNNNVKSIDDLIKKHKKGLINLPNNILKGLKYVNLIKEHIPRKEIDFLKNILENMLFNIDPKLIGVICGSYRRQNDYSNDVDFIISHTNPDDTINYLKQFIIALKKQKIIIDSLTEDNVETKYMGLFKINKEIRRIDIRYIPYKSFYPALLYFTGSKDFNKKMRFKAKEMGYKLNEYGIYKNNREIFINSEKEIFDILHIVYITPDKR